MSYTYAQDESEKSVSFISNIGFTQPRRSSVNGGTHQIKLENYNSVYQQNFKPTSDVLSSNATLHPQYPDFSKDASNIQPKQESPLKFASGILAPNIPVSQPPSSSALMQGYISEINTCMPILVPATAVASVNGTTPNPSANKSEEKNEFCFADGGGSPGLSASQSSGENSFRKYQCLDASMAASGTQAAVMTTETHLTPSQTQGAYVSSLPVRNSSVSEALFVQIIVSRCKRIAPLWFRGISSMRERNREENRRTSTNAGQTQNDWSIIAGKIREMNQVMETDTVVNLLKKLHKELPADSVLKFIKCWLGDPEALNDPDFCVLSRPDAKGRMRRIDGGKGSDKVWRLDTIVGMLYHGLPMSSTDTNIMVHTCAQELCVRPQHIRFRASSVALVIVLKALAQAGYSIIPPNNPGDTNPRPPDESVDVFGPFTIEELQQYRSENLTPAGESVSRVPLNASDRDLVESLPMIRDLLNQNHSQSHHHQQQHHGNGSRGDPPKAGGTAAAPLPIQPNTEIISQPNCHLNGSLVPEADIKPPLFQPNAALPTKLTPSATSRFQPAAAAAASSTSSSNSSSSTTNHPTTKSRRSLKRTAAHAAAAKEPPSTASTTTNVVATTSAPSAPLPDANVFLSKQIGDPQQLPTHFTTQPAAALIGCNHHLHQSGGMQPLYAPQPIGPPSVPPGAPLSGKSTPRQPAKKRLEARTPTIEEPGVPPSAFKALHDTPFTPVLGRSSCGGTSVATTVTSTTSPGSGPRETSGTIASSASTTVSTSSATTKPASLSVAREDEEDEEMKTIFAGPVAAARRHHSTVIQPQLAAAGLAYADYRSFQERLLHHQQLQHQSQALNSPAVMESPNSLFLRTTPCGKRCASACALPSLSPSGLAGYSWSGSGNNGSGGAEDLRQMPSLLPVNAVAPGTTTTAAGSDQAAAAAAEASELSNGTTSVGVEAPQMPRPPSLLNFGGRQSKTPFGGSVTPSSIGLFDRDTPGGLRSLSRFRDSPIFPTNSEILDVLVSLAQEYGVQSNRAGSSCSRPQSQHYLRRSLFTGTDSPSPSGLPLNMLSAASNSTTSTALGTTTAPAGHPAPSGDLLFHPGDSQPPPPPNFGH